MAPEPASSMAGSTARHARTAAMRSRLMVASQSSSVMLRNPPVRTGVAPTLLTRTSTRPSAAATRVAGPLGAARSTSTACTCPVFARSSSSAEDFFAPAITRAPLAARARVTASPIPLLPPVTTAVCPVSRTSMPSPASLEPVVIRRVVLRLRSADSGSADSPPGDPVSDAARATAARFPGLGYDDAAESLYPALLVRAAARTHKRQWTPRAWVIIVEADSLCQKAHRNLRPRRQPDHQAG